MELNNDTVRTLLQLLNIVITCGVGIYAWLANRHKVTNDRISELEAAMDVRLDDHAHRLAVLEAKADAAPTHTDLSKVHEKLHQVAQGQSRMEGQLTSLNDNMRMLLNRIAQKGMP